MDKCYSTWLQVSGRLAAMELEHVDLAKYKAKAITCTDLSTTYLQLIAPLIQRWCRNINF